MVLLKNSTVIVLLPQKLQPSINKRAVSLGASICEASGVSGGVGWGGVGWGMFPFKTLIPLPIYQ